MGLEIHRPGGLADNTTVVMGASGGIGQVKA